MRAPARLVERCAGSYNLRRLVVDRKFVFAFQNVPDFQQTPGRSNVRGLMLGGSLVPWYASFWERRLRV